MPMPALLSVKGTTQGLMTEGAGTQEGREDFALVQAFDHLVEMPTDPQSGTPSGQRRHRPFIITKAVDKSTPLLYNALVNGEHLEEVKLQLYHIDATGNEEHCFTITLEEAIITNINLEMPHCQDAKMERFTQFEKVAFQYRKIVWTDELNGVEGQDDWLSQA